MRIHDSMTKTVCRAEVMRPRAKASCESMPASVLVLVHMKHRTIKQWPTKGILTSEEVYGLVGNKVTRKVLSCVHATHNESAVQVSATEELQIIRFLDVLLELNGSTHHSNGFSGAALSLCAPKTLDCLCGFLQTSLSHQPPGRLGSDEEEDSERGGKHPLECDRNSNFRVVSVLGLCLT